MSQSLAVAGGVEHPFHRELLAAVAAGAREWGIDCELVADPARAARHDALLIVGHPHLYPAFRAAALAGESARRHICWYGENLPRRPASAAERLVRALPTARMLDAAMATLGRLGGRGARDRLLRWREHAAVERELGRNQAELAGARDWLDELVVPSANRVAGAALAGWQARRVPFGYHPLFAGPIVEPDGMRRDIDVVFLGRDIVRGSRRARHLSTLRQRLAGRASVVVVERDLYGAERHALLSRARVVANIQRVPGNSTGMRHILAAAAGATLVEESSDDTWLADPGRFLVEVSLSEQAEAILALLADEPRRRELVEASQALLRSNLSMAESVRRVVGGEGADTMVTTR